MNWISKDNWYPPEGYKLEVEAMNSVISNQNTLVVAGPGAGKTELLAQRACFLLETNTCRHPKKILAISFKKDAAENLKERVTLRCGKELASRFESRTYDAFAKEILDRFRNSIDKRYRPLKSYKIAEDPDVRNAFIISGMASNITSRDFKKIYASRLCANKLPFEKNSREKIFINTWETMLKGNVDKDFGSFLTYEMISRLTEFLIRTNVYIKKAIELTYSHVFLDEFQDTTSIQYELVKTCFYQTASILTAVGDSKQRIMVWAGARKSIFDDYQRDFESVKRTLIMNHRSAPRLVHLQMIMYNSLNESPNGLTTNDKWGINDGEAYLRIFNNHLKEAEVVCSEVVQLVETGVALKDICILVKQQVNIYGKEIIVKLSKMDIKARDEALYQDLLKEDIIKILVSLFKLAIGDKSPYDWEYLYDILSEINGVDENTKPQKLFDFINGISSLISNIKSRLTISDVNEFSKLLEFAVNTVSYEKLASKFQQYKSKVYFDSLIDNFQKLLWCEYIKTNDWKKAIENFEGENSIPIMTIHKSKGLEYDTVFFVGLEDAAFWNFRNQPEEDRCAFFVALSRAKRRIDFTFSANRPTNFSNTQSHNCINEFYELLNTSTIIEKIEY